MKKTTLKFMAAIVIMLTCCTALFSFTDYKGGEGFEIYLNNKLVIQKFGNSMNSIYNIPADKITETGQIVIKYYHCGRVGKHRVVTLTNQQNNLLKQWKFDDAASVDALMILDAKGIFSLQQNVTGPLNLYYSSSEIPKGRLLARIGAGPKDITAK